MIWSVLKDYSFWHKKIIIINSETETEFNLVRNFDFMISQTKRKQGQVHPSASFVHQSNTRV